MTDIPDEVVERALKAFDQEEIKHRYPSTKECLRAAGRVFVEWERGEIRRIAKTAWLTSSHVTIGDAEYGEAICAEIEAAILARSEGE